MNKLVVISHTAHYVNSEGIVVGWGPTVTEINYLATIFEKVIHLAPLHVGNPPKSEIPYKSNVQFVGLKPSGGKGFKKLTLLIAMFYNLSLIQKHTKRASIIQFRAPTGMGIYVLPYLSFFNRNPYWVKYAGNWVGTALPLGNSFQRWWLKNVISKETKVTVNGNWIGSSKNIIAFENPCLTLKERQDGKTILSEKVFEDKLNYCFVGGLNENKGVDKLIALMSKLNNEKIGVVHIIGDGILRKQLELKAEKAVNRIVFHGFIPKENIIEIYKQCHFLVLPSKSEGFPKVIGEAMNFGCVPIVSEVSCINQYIKHQKNGYLFDPLSSEELQGVIEKSLTLSNENFKMFLEVNYNIAEKFTYDYFLKRIQKEIVAEPNPKN